ncbi:hypothetical protein [Streptomyces sp. NPDC058964]|uniref:hypothetical protein n=1 Tax=Streptomyces sp. NPDC058964 TaxID=3346681 RepID=UPI00367A993B
MSTLRKTGAVGVAVDLGVAVGECVRRGPERADEDGVVGGHTVVGDVRRGVIDRGEGGRFDARK